MTRARQSQLQSSARSHLQGLTIAVPAMQHGDKVSAQVDEVNHNEPLSKNRKQSHVAISRELSVTAHGACVRSIPLLKAHEAIAMDGLGDCAPRYQNNRTGTNGLDTVNAPQDRVRSLRSRFNRVSIRRTLRYLRQIYRED